jgi:hypothetical protein
MGQSLRIAGDDDAVEIGAANFRDCRALLLPSGDLPGTADQKFGSASICCTPVGFATHFRSCDARVRIQNARIKPMNLMGHCYRELGMFDLAAKQLEDTAKEIGSMGCDEKGRSFMVIET